METCKIFFYALMVLCFVGAGMCEFAAGNFRLGMASLLLGVVQMLIFLVGRN